VVDAELTGQLVLPNDLVMTPVAQLPPEVRRRFASKDGDVVLSRLGTRLRSCVIDAPGADLLAFFRSPTRIVDAIVGYCEVQGLGPRETLIAAYPMFKALVSDGLLVGAEQLAPEASVSLLAPGHPFEMGTVVRCLRHLDDTEVYEVQLSGGGRAALKVGRNTGVRALAREARFLRTMEGEIAPRLLAQLEVAGNPALLLEWCEGTSSAIFAASLRLNPAPEAQRALLALCRGIATTYAALHAHGVIHGDVHPDNVRVAADGTVRLLDFGLARRIGERDTPTLPRGAVWFFLAPERARGLLDGPRLRAPTTRSEQYAVAALLYLLWTGEHYIEFLLDATEMLRQIRDDAPRPFAALAAVPCSLSLERALGRALSKDPRRRYPDVRALASAIADDSRGLATRSPTAGVKEFVSATLRSCRLTGRFARSQKPPTASVYYGAAGVAFALLRMARARQQPDLLSLSDGWCVLAEQELRLRRGSEIDAPEFDPVSISPVTPYHRGSGVALVRSAISYSFGDDLGATSARHLFVRRADVRAASVPELTLGYAGVLAATASLVELSAPRGDTSLVAFGDRVAKQLLADLGKLGTPGRSPLVALGMAHGWAGVLYALLRWLRVRARTIDPRLLQSLHDLAGLRLRTGRRYRWPVFAPSGSRRNAGGSLQGWCNGSAGMVLLWTEAAAATGDRTFWQLAEGAAHDCVSDAVGSFNLCCGLTGRAYSLLVLARESRDPKWRDRARELGSLALQSRRAGIDGEASGYPRSLFRGDLGLAMLLVELDGPEDVGFPFVESL